MSEAVNLEQQHLLQTARIHQQLLRERPPTEGLHAWMPPAQTRGDMSVGRGLLDHEGAGGGGGESVMDGGTEETNHILESDCNSPNIRRTKFIVENTCLFYR